jgi:hypothetical protein
MTRRFDSFDEFCGRKRRLESSTKDSSLLKDESLTSLLPFLANFMCLEPKKHQKVRNFHKFVSFCSILLACKLLCGRWDYFLAKKHVLFYLRG